MHLNWNAQPKTQQVWSPSVKVVRRRRASWSVPESAILASLEGKEIQQVAQELAVSVLTVGKWRKRFALWGPRGLRDQPRSGKPATYDAAFRDRVRCSRLLEQPPPPGMSHWDGPAMVADNTWLQRVCGMACSSSRRHLPAKAAQLVCEYG